MLADVWNTYGKNLKFKLFRKHNATNTNFYKIFSLIICDKLAFFSNLLNHY